LVSLRDAVAPRASAIPPTTRQGIGRHCDAPSGTLEVAQVWPKQPTAPLPTKPIRHPSSVRLDDARNISESESRACSSAK
jgi:hypothetical protein